jgi:hypothetical protein
MVTAKFCDFQPDGMPVNKLMSFFELNLIFGAVTHLDSTLERCLSISFRDVVAAMCFVNKNLHMMWGNLYHTATDCEVVELAIGVTLGITDN